VQPPQQILEQAVGLIFLGRPSGEGAAQRRGNASLVGQAFDTDDSPFHVKLGRLL